MSIDTGAVTHPDPRPRRIDPAGVAQVAGLRCTSCRRPSPVTVARCPVCFARVAPENFGPSGRVWSSTIVHIPVGRRDAPYCLVYVDLDDGPRILARVAPTPPQRLVAGTTVTLAPAADDSGDPFVTVMP